MCGQLLYVVEEGGLIGAQRGMNERSGLGLPYGGGSPARGNDLSLYTPVRKPNSPGPLPPRALPLGPGADLYYVLLIINTHRLRYVVHPYSTALPRPHGAEG